MSELDKAIQTGDKQLVKELVINLVSKYVTNQSEAFKVRRELNKL